MPLVVRDLLLAAQAAPVVFCPVFIVPYPVDVAVDVYPDVHSPEVVLFRIDRPGLPRDVLIRPYVLELGPGRDGVGRGVEIGGMRHADVAFAVEAQGLAALAVRPLQGPLHLAVVRPGGVLCELALSFVEGPLAFQAFHLAAARCEGRRDRDDTRQAEHPKVFHGVSFPCIGLALDPADETPTESPRLPSTLPMNVSIPVHLLSAPLRAVPTRRRKKSPIRN